MCIYGDAGNDTILTIDQLNEMFQNKVPTPENVLVSWTDKAGRYHERFMMVFWECNGDGPVKVGCRSYSDCNGPTSGNSNDSGNFPLFYRNKTKRFEASNLVIRDSVRLVKPGEYPTVVLNDGITITCRTMTSSSAALAEFLEIETVDGSSISVPITSISYIRN